MKDFILTVIGFILLVVAVYFVATLFRHEPARDVPDDSVGYCTNYGDCY